MNIETFDQYLLELGIGGKERELIISYVLNHIASEKFKAVDDFCQYLNDNYSGNLHDMVVKDYVKYHLK